MVVLNHKTGEKHLVDFKTVRVDPNNKYKQTPEGKLGKSWNGKPSKADGYSKQQNASAILTNLNEEIEFDTISLLPIQVWYPEKGQSTDIAKVSTESLTLSKEDIEDVFPKEYADQLKSSAPQTSEVEIEVTNKKYSRNSLDNDSSSMYLFTDNAERTSRPTASSPNITEGWYAEKYKDKTSKPLHYGSTSNPTSAVIRGKNNAYPISTMSAYGTNWTNENFDLFKDTIDDEIAQIKQDLSKFKTLKLGDFRIGQGGRFAKLPSQHQSYLDSKLLELGIDNSGNSPKVVKPTQQTSEVETGVVDFKPEDITISNKLETFEVFIEGNQENGTVGIKGYKIDIKNQPNVNLIATKYYSDAKGTQLPNGWQVLELKGGLRLPMTGAPGGAVSSKKDISLELPITLNNVQDTDSNKKILEEIGFDFNVSSSVIKNVTYTPKGKKKQLYTISGNKIYNSKKIEVFKTDSVDRNKIFANLAIKEGRAKKVTFKGTDYIVNNKEQIISSVTGKTMNWGPENGNRRAILSLYNRSEEQVATPKPPTSDASAAFGIPTEELDADELKKWKNIDNDSNNPFEEC